MLHGLSILLLLRHHVRSSNPNVAMSRFRRSRRASSRLNLLWSATVGVIHELVQAIYIYETTKIYVRVDDKNQTVHTKSNFVSEGGWRERIKMIFLHEHSRNQVKSHAIQSSLDGFDEVIRSTHSIQSRQHCILPTTKIILYS